MTSSNAVKIVKALPNRNIFFIPDGNLGGYVAGQVPEKNVILNDGYCPVHKAMTAEFIQETKKRHPGALVLAHPECEKDVLAFADAVGSTADLIRYAKESDGTEFIICTEEGVSFRLREDNPEKRFYFPEGCACCWDMKRNTLEKLLHVLTTGENAVELDEELCRRAVRPLERMLELAK